MSERSNQERIIAYYRRLEGRGYNFVGFAGVPTEDYLAAMTPRPRSPWEHFKMRLQPSRPLRSQEDLQRDIEVIDCMIEAAEIGMFDGRADRVRRGMGVVGNLAVTGFYVQREAVIATHLGEIVDFLWGGFDYHRVNRSGAPPDRVRFGVTMDHLAQQQSASPHFGYYVPSVPMPRPAGHPTES